MPQVCGVCARKRRRKRAADVFGCAHIFIVAGNCVVVAIADVDVTKALHYLHL